MLSILCKCPGLDLILLTLVCLHCQFLVDDLCILDSGFLESLPQTSGQPDVGFSFTAELGLSHHFRASFSAVSNPKVQNQKASLTVCVGRSCSHFSSPPSRYGDKVLAFGDLRFSQWTPVPRGHPRHCYLTQQMLYFSTRWDSTMSQLFHAHSWKIKSQYVHLSSVGKSRCILNSEIPVESLS